MIPWVHLSPHPKRHVDRLSLFAQVTVECPITLQCAATFFPNFCPWWPWPLTFDLGIQALLSEGPNTSVVWIWRKSVQPFLRYFIHKQKSHWQCQKQNRMQLNACGNNEAAVSYESEQLFGISLNYKPLSPCKNMPTTVIHLLLLDCITCTMYVDAVYCYWPSSMVCRSVTLVSPAKTKRSRCRLGWGLGWAHDIMYYMGVQIPP